MLLNDWQKAVARTYGNGDYDQFEVDGKISDDNLEQCGDTLFIFLMLDLSDAEDCDSSEEAIRRLESARRQIDEAIEAVKNGMVTSLKCESPARWPGFGFGMG